MSPRDVALWTPMEAANADRRAAGTGMSIATLMGAAAYAIVAEVPPCGRIAVLAGRGNNGGDAFAAARLLRDGGRDVTVFAAGDRSGMEGAARDNADAFGQTVPLAAFEPAAFAIAIDGLFGGGLSREIEGREKAAIERLNAGSSFVLSIDLPSGVDGATGAVGGVAVKATRTVTFERRKPGHLLLPGRALCGEIAVRPIGMPVEAFDASSASTFANEPALWQHRRLIPDAAHHKYDRGHVGVFSGGATTSGAARLSAMAALRGGAGLVTVLSRSSALLVNAGHLTAIMLKRCEDDDDLRELLEDARFSTFVLGPGFGPGETARVFVGTILENGRSLVLDADGLTSFADEPDALFEAISSARGRAVLTPHPGEFARLFPDLADLARMDRLAAARAAAGPCGATVLLKGSDTVVSAPDGRAAINTTGTPALATAGSGDVLAGLIAGELANGVPAFEAACAGAWIHGKAAQLFGVGLIAEDLPGLVPAVLAGLTPTD